MKRSAEFASPRGDPALEAMSRLVWLQRRAIRLERKLERLRSQEGSVFRPSGGIPNPNDPSGLSRIGDAAVFGLTSTLKY